MKAINITHRKYIKLVLLLGLLWGTGLVWHANFIKQIGDKESQVPIPKPQYEFSKQGVIQFTNLEGGCWFLLVDKKLGGASKYELTGIERSKLTQYRNQTVEIHGKLLTNRVSICQIGKIVEVQEVKLLKDTSIDTSISSTSFDNIQDESLATNWQTYRNDEFDFEVKYPLEYASKKSCAPRVVPDRKPLLFVGPITFRFDDPKGLTLKEYVDKIERETRPDPKNGISVNRILSREKVLIDGAEGEKIISEVIAAGGYNPHVIYLKRGARILVINYDDGIINQCPIGEIDEPSKVADQILSTFRFID